MTNDSNSLAPPAHSSSNSTPSERDDAVSDLAIDTLRSEAAEAGDRGVVELCDRALRGDAAARARCAARIRALARATETLEASAEVSARARSRA